MRCAAAPQGSRIPWQIVQGEAPQPPAGTVYQDLSEIRGVEGQFATDT